MTAQILTVVVPLAVFVAVWIWWVVVLRHRGRK